MSEKKDPVMGVVRDASFEIFKSVGRSFDGPVSGKPIPVAGQQKMSETVTVESSLKWADSIADGMCQECGSDGYAQCLAAEVRRLRGFEPRDTDSFIEVSKIWGRAQEAKEARQLVANLEETELRVKSRDEEMSRSLHNVRILAEDFRKMAGPISDLRNLFAWPIAFMKLIS